jgi:thymidylate synthase (FAD)
MKVTYEDHMGSDLKVVNAARVSFGKRSEWDPTHYPLYERLKPSDARLIQFLARGCTTGQWDSLVLEAAEHGSNWLDGDYPERDPLIEILREVRSMPTHWTPFGHCQITLVIKAPIFVARQLFKHKVGSVENEVSRRYVTDEPEFWTPEEWRKASDDKKQGSGGPCANQHGLTMFYEDSCRASVMIYNDLVATGVCPEQARAVLPQATYTEWWVTGSLFYWASLFNARSRGDAQQETQQIARQIGEIVEPLYPVSWKALTT